MIQSRFSSQLSSPRAVKILAVTLALLMALTACAGSGGDSTVSRSATATTSASPTATPTPSLTPTATYKPASAEGPAKNVPLPVLPEEAKKETKAGLEAFAKYWYELVEYAYETGDLKPLKGVSGPNCTSCAYAYDIVTRGFEGEDWLVGGEFKFFSESTKFKKTQKDQYQTLLQLTQTDVTSYRADGSVASVLSEQPAAVQILEATYEDGWQADNVETISKP